MAMNGILRFAASWPIQSLMVVMLFAHHSMPLLSISAERSRHLQPGVLSIPILANSLVSSVPAPPLAGTGGGAGATPGIGVPPHRACGAMSVCTRIARPQTLHAQPASVRRKLHRSIIQ